MKCMKTGREGTSQKEGYVILLKNITEFKELDSAKTTFISTISHELKTPISAILMSLQLLEDSRVGSLNDEQQELAQSIQDNSDRLLSITSELLNMTRVESGKLQLKPRVTKPIELIEYAIKANRVQAEKFNIRVEVQYPDEKIGKLFVDSEKDCLGADEPTFQRYPVFSRKRAYYHRCAENKGQLDRNVRT